MEGYSNSPAEELRTAKASRHPERSHELENALDPEGLDRALGSLRARQANLLVSSRASQEEMSSPWSSSADRCGRPAASMRYLLHVLMSGCPLGVRARSVRFPGWF
jgi:hypothetical protein